MSWLLISLLVINSIEFYVIGVSASCLSSINGPSNLQQGRQSHKSAVLVSHKSCRLVIIIRCASVTCPGTHFRCTSSRIYKCSCLLALGPVVWRLFMLWFEGRHCCCCRFQCWIINWMLINRCPRSGGCDLLVNALQRHSDRTCIHNSWVVPCHQHTHVCITCPHHPEVHLMQSYSLIVQSIAQSPINSPVGS